MLTVQVSEMLIHAESTRARFLTNKVLYMYLVVCARFPHSAPIASFFSELAGLDPSPI